ncbi:MAG: hypothetical protein IJ758_03430 [Clostridia bacterium]|nr:hypothetical protein [Clostridia bacterium]
MSTKGIKALNDDALENISGGQADENYLKKAAMYWAMNDGGVTFNKFCEQVHLSPEEIQDIKNGLYHL